MDKDCLTGPMDLDDLVDLLDGEAVIVSPEGDYCFSHQIFLNDKCMECGFPLKPMFVRVPTIASDPENMTVTGR